MEPPRIGVFDSGVGGLWVWREIVRILPDAATVYWADRAHVPYGEPQGEIPTATPNPMRQKT